MNKIKQKNSISEELNSYYFDGINHTLMTPLNVIKGINEILINENINDEIKAHIETSIKACDNLELYIYRLILFSKINNGDVKAIAVPFSLQSFIKEALKFSAMSCKKSDKQYDFKLSTNIPDIVIGDYNILKQLIFNFVSDVVRNYEVHKILLDLSWEPKSAKSGTFLFTIYTDIPKSPDEDEGFSFLRSMFERLSASINGEVYLKTVDDITSAHIQIPFETSKTLSDESGNATFTLHSFTAKTAKILVVDDYKANLTIMSSLLKDTQISIDTAESGSEALALLNHNQYDIIFIDYLMPNMNGIELMNHIKSDYPETFKSTPVFVLSATSNSELRADFVDAGFSGFIPKPIDSNVLAYIIKENLPDTKISYTKNKETKQLSEDELNQYRDLLRTYSINLDNGLHYTSNDFDQYLFIAKLYTENYKRNKNKMKKLIENKDLEGIRIYAHTVKSNAKQIGSDGLFQLSAKIEERIPSGNWDYLNKSEPLFFYLVDECLEGLSKFIELYNTFHKLELTKSDDIFEYTKDTYKDALKDAIEGMEHSPALNIIEKTIELELDKDNQTILEQIYNYLEDFELNEALLLAKEL